MIALDAERKQLLKRFDRLSAKQKGSRTGTVGAYGAGIKSGAYTT